MNGKFRARDLGSANGTFVNKAGISAVDLFDGDQLQIGTTVLSLSFLPDGTNPHQKDGVVFRSIDVDVESNAGGEEPTRRFDLPSSLREQAAKQSEDPVVTPSGTHVP